MKHNKFKDKFMVRDFCIQQFPFIAEDFDALTTYELLCKVIAHLNEVLKDVGEMDEKVDGFEERLDNLTEDFATQDELDDVQNQVLDISDDITDIFSAIRATNASVTQNTNDITTINGQINDINEDIANLESFIDEIPEVYATKEEVETVKNELETEIDGVQTQVTELSTSLDGVNDQVVQNTTDIGRFNSQIDIVYEEIGEVAADVETNTTAIANHETRIEALEEGGGGGGEYGYYVLDNEDILRQLFASLSLPGCTIDFVRFTYCNHMITFNIRVTLTTDINNNVAFTTTNFNANTIRPKLTVLDYINSGDISGVFSSMSTTGLMTVYNKSGATIRNGTRLQVTHVYPTDTTFERIEELFGEYKVTT